MNQNCCTLQENVPPADVSFSPTPSSLSGTPKQACRGHKPLREKGGEAQKPLGENGAQQPQEAKPAQEPLGEAVRRERKERSSTAILVGKPAALFSFLVNLLLDTHIC